MRGILFYLFTLTLAFADHKVLGKPMMFEKSFLESVNMGKTSKHICHSGVNTTSQSLSSGSKVNTDYFNAQITCKYECKSGVTKTEVLSHEFRPKNLSLYAGDGSSDQKVIWRSLGVTLVTWSKEKCLEKASSSCEGINKVKSFNPQKIKSGNWSFDGVLNCSRKDILYSPFDERFKLDNTPASTPPTFQGGFNNSMFDRQVVSNTLTEFLNTSDLKSKASTVINQANCISPIKVKTCFGDCVWESQDDSKWSETLSTDKFLGDDRFTVCADSFKKLINNPKRSQSVNKFKCEKLIWEIMRELEIIGSSCAALRTEIDCSAIL